jgi:YVTN family beta-propeller protein
MKKIAFVWCIVIMSIGCACSQAQSDYRLVNTISLPGEGFWDYVSVDEANNRLYVSHSSMVHVVDLKTGKQVGEIADTKGVHGIAIASDLNKGFTSNGRDASVTVFNLKTLEKIENVKVSGENPDAILYDSYSKRVFTGNGGSSSFTVIDAVNNKVVGTIPLDGKPEAIVTDGNGKIYVNIEDKSCINVIDANTLKVINRWPLSSGEEPTGLALDNQNHLLFSACGNELIVVTDAFTGKEVTTVPIGEGCDGAFFDPYYKRAYASNGEGTLTVIQEDNTTSFHVLETVATQQGARTMTLDKSSHHLYLPAADFEQAASGIRPATKPGSFVILDIETIK